MGTEMGDAAWGEVGEKVGAEILEGDERRWVCGWENGIFYWCVKNTVENCNQNSGRDLNPLSYP